MIYIISLAVFSAVIFTLVGMLLLVESRVSTEGEHQVTINEDPDSSISVSGTPTLLSALIKNDVLLPSACGGNGSCGMCKCVVTEGGGSIMPTELAHLSRKDKLQGRRLSCQLKVKNDMKIQVPESIFGIKKFEATVTSNENVATFIKELVLKPDEPMNFKSGSYIQIDVPEYELDFKDLMIGRNFISEWKKYNLFGLKSKAEKPGFRAYSLANPPHVKDVLMLTVRIATPPPGSTGIPPGFGSSYVFGLKPGDRVTVSGPYGDFFIKETQKEMCFIGGGAGMAPLRCHVLHLIEGLKSNRKITFWYGARSKKELFYYNLFKQLEDKHDNFKFFTALSQPMPEDNWDGMTGFIHTNLLEHYLLKHDDPADIEYYLCGPPPMIDAIIKELDELGIDENMIFYDKF